MKENKKRKVVEEKIPVQVVEPEPFEFKAIHQNLPYWDFKHAEDEFGLEFSETSENGFYTFVDNLFYNNLSLLRNAFIRGDVKNVRDEVHKCKATCRYLFSLIYYRLIDCYFLGDPSDELMKYCSDLLPDDKKLNLNGQPPKSIDGSIKAAEVKVTPKMRDLYVDLVIKVELFIGIFANFSYAISNITPFIIR